LIKLRGGYLFIGAVSGLVLGASEGDGAQNIRIWVWHRRQGDSNAATQIGGSRSR
jgi:hypothetical protein